MPSSWAIWVTVEERTATKHLVRKVFDGLATDSFILSDFGAVQGYTYNVNIDFAKSQVPAGLTLAVGTNTDEFNEGFRGGLMRFVRQIVNIQE